MCGIAGIVGSSRIDAEHRAALGRMLDLLAHRGPDDAGDYLTENVALGHRRLSVIDLRTGRFSYEAVAAAFRWTESVVRMPRSLFSVLFLRRCAMNRSLRSRSCVRMSVATLRVMSEYSFNMGSK